MKGARRNWFAHVDEVRANVARLINADADEVAFVQNTGQGLSMVAGAMNLSAGDRIICSTAEYPSNVYPWMALAKATGAEVVMIPERVDEHGQARVVLDDVLREISHRRTRLVAISHVQWASGQLTDLHSIGQACHDFGVGFVVDAIQSMGVVPINVKGLKVDAVVAGSHKWLLSPGGAGVLWMRKELIADATPNHVGWNSVVEPFKWEQIRFDLRADAQRFEPGTLPMTSIVGLGAAVELLLEVGVARVFEQVLDLNRLFRDGIEKLGATVATPSEAGAGSVCFTFAGHDPLEMYKRLASEHNVELAMRGGRVRFSPHFYNTKEQVERTLAAVGALVRKR